MLFRSTFVVLSSYICGIVLVEIKLLQVICNTYVGLESMRKFLQKKKKKKKPGGKKKNTQSGEQKPPLKG